LKKAEARYFADLRQSKKPHNVIKKKANELRLEINGQLWYPNVSKWWDSECEKKFEDIQLLASMWEIDLLKAPKKFGEIYPDVCKKYFDFLAKKRFNAPSDSKDENSDETVKIKKSKSFLQKLYDEKKALCTDSKKSDDEILKEVVEELNKKEIEANLKSMKKNWKPHHKPYYDEECEEAFKKLIDQSIAMGFDLEGTISHYKKFKLKNKVECSNYFKLLDDKRTEYNLKQQKKEEEKSKKKGLESDNENNKKDELETEEDVVKTIKLVEKVIVKEEKKEKKKKIKEKTSEECTTISKIEDESKISVDASKVKKELASIKEKNSTVVNNTEVMKETEKGFKKSVKLEKAENFVDKEEEPLKKRKKLKH